MEEKEILSHLDNAIGDMVPEFSDNLWSKEENIPMKKEDLLPGKKKPKKWIYEVAAAAACLACIIGIQYSTNNRVATTINLDINPSIEIALNKNDTILSVTALNEDAVTVTEQLSWKKGESLDSLLSKTVSELTKEGYLSQDTQTILVSVENKTASHSNEIMDDISNVMEKNMVARSVTGSVISQTMTREDREIQELSENLHISPGKATFISRMVDENDSLSVKELAPMDMDDIVTCGREEEIDFGKFTRNAPPAPESQPKPSANPTKKAAEKTAAPKTEGKIKETSSPDTPTAAKEKTPKSDKKENRKKEPEDKKDRQDRDSSSTSKPAAPKSTPDSKEPEQPDNKKPDSPDREKPKDEQPAQTNSPKTQEPAPTKNPKPDPDQTEKPKEPKPDKPAQPEQPPYKPSR